MISDARWEAMSEEEAIAAIRAGKADAAPRRPGWLYDHGGEASPAALARRDAEQARTAAHAAVDELARLITDAEAPHPTPRQLEAIRTARKSIDTAVVRMYRGLSAARSKP